jgi:hypothetical protein
MHTYRDKLKREQERPQGPCYAKGVYVFEQDPNRQLRIREYAELAGEGKGLFSGRGREE